MGKVDALYVLPSKNPVSSLDDVKEKIVNDFEKIISRVHFKETELKVFFKKPISLHTIDKVLELIVDVKKMRWTYQKKIGNGTSILEVLIE